MALVFMNRVSDHRIGLMLAVAVVLAACAIWGPARAEPDAACSHFSWPLDVELVWLRATDLASQPSGATRPE